MFGFEHDTPAVIVAPHRREYAPESEAFPPDPAPRPDPAAPGSRFVCERPDRVTYLGERYAPGHFPGPGHADERYSRHVVPVPGGLAVLDDEDGALVCTVAAGADGTVGQWQASGVWGVLAARRLREAAEDAAGDLRVLAGRPGVPPGAQTECLLLADRLYLAEQASRLPRDRDRPADAPDGPARERQSYDDPNRGVQRYDRSNFPRPNADKAGVYDGAGVERDGAFLVVRDPDGGRAFYLPAPCGVADHDQAEAVYRYLGAGVMRTAAKGALEVLAQLADAVEGGTGSPAFVRAAAEGVRADLARGLAAMLPPWRRPKVDPAG